MDAAECRRDKILFRAVLGAFLAFIVMGLLCVFAGCTSHKECPCCKCPRGGDDCPKCCPDHSGGEKNNSSRCAKQSDQEAVAAVAAAVAAAP